MNFAIKMDDQVSPGAKSAVANLRLLDSAIKQEGATLRALETQMRNLNRGGVVNIETARKLSDAIAAQKGKLAGMTESLVRAGGAGFQDTARKSEALNAAMSTLATEAGAVGRALSALGPYGVAAAAAIGAIAVAALATGGAIAYLTSKLLTLGTQASEAKGDITRSLELLYGSQKAAEHTYDVLESLTGDIAISQDRVMELSQTLIKAGQVNGDAMVASIAAIGKAEAARAGAGKVLEGVITRAASSRMFSISRDELRSVGISYRELSKEIAKGIGGTVGDAELMLRTGGVRMKAGLDALNRVVDSKMGDLAARKLMTVGTQAQRVRDAFTRLFEGMNTGEGLARVLNAVANALDRSSVSGAALRATLQNAFKEITAAIEFAIPYVQEFFDLGVLLALKLYNALYPVRKALKGMFGDAGAGGVQSFEDAGLKAVNAIAAGFGMIAKLTAFAIEQAKTLMAIFKVAADAIPGVGALGAAADAAGGVASLISAIPANDNAHKSGENTAAGVAAGIKANSKAVADAMAAMGYEGQAAYDRSMQIKSPSQVMMKRGKFLREGLTQGIKGGGKESADALASTTPANDVKPAGRSLSASAGGVSVQVTFQSGSVVIGPGGDVGTAKSQLTELMADVFQQAALMQGVG